MLRFPSRRRRGALISGIVLLVLAVRALVPAGFMPAGDGSLSLMICPAALMADGLSAGGPDHSGSPGHSDHCPFAFAPAAAPVPHFTAALAEAMRAPAPLPPIELLRPTLRSARSHQARAPPGLV